MKFSSGDPFETFAKEEKKVTSTFQYNLQEKMGRGKRAKVFSFLVFSEKHFHGQSLRVLDHKTWNKDLTVKDKQPRNESWNEK